MVGWDVEVGVCDTEEVGCCVIACSGTMRRGMVLLVDSSICRRVKGVRMTNPKESSLLAAEASRDRRVHELDDGNSLRVRAWATTP